MMAEPDVDAWLASKTADPVDTWLASRSPPPSTSKAYTGQILPFSVNEQGQASLDTNAGLIGALKRPFTFTHDVMTGAVPADVRNPEYIGGALGSALTYGPGAVASRAGPGIVKAPPSEAIKEAGEEGFKAYRQSGQMYPGDEYRTLLQNTRDQLNKAGLVDDPKSASVQHRVINNELERVKKAPFVTSEDLDTMRIALAGKGPASMQARDNLFGYIEQNLPPDSGRSVRDAVGNYRQAMHSDVVTGKDAAKSGLNIAKAQGPELTAEQQRTNIAQLLNSKNALRGFSDTEKNILTSARDATPGVDFAQRWGDRLKLAGGGGAAGLPGVGAAITAAASGHPVLAAGLAAASTIPAGAGAVARSYANRGARQLAEEADNAIRLQSPMAQQNLATLPANARAAPGSYAMGSGGMIAAAMEARRREQAARQNMPQQYRVLPDGTVEELL